MSVPGHSYRWFTCIQFLAVFLFAQRTFAAGELSDPYCRAKAHDQLAQVAHIIDGDTVVLKDGRRIRLIGIDTPELGRDKQPDQPWSGAAKDYLTTLLRERQNIIAIVYDRQRRDAYHRTLAHMFLEDGTNIQGLILGRGLALPLTIPPNLKFLDCYQAQAQRAIDARTGLWSQAEIRPRPAASLSGSERGYHIITGKVTRIGTSRSSVWLNLGRDLAVRIVNTDLDYFANLDINALAGDRIMVRGMIYQRNGQLRIRVRHPVDMQVMNE